MVARFFFNHIGIQADARPHVLLNVSDGREGALQLLTTAGEHLVKELSLGPPTKTFRGATVRQADLSGVVEGRYVLRFGDEWSHPFRLGKDLLLSHTLHAVLNYFFAQRSSPPWDEADRAVPFFGSREGTVDVHGGWHDASGDMSKYLSHLSYANYMNPQQTPLVVWGMLEHLERRKNSHAAGVAERLKEEARHGADFLCRMQDPEGYFYMTVFDQWKKGTDQRVICAFRTQKGDLLEEYQAGMRQGGGATVAALARAGRIFDEPRYIHAAETGLQHLLLKGTSYLDDGKENIIDDYCALLAAAELYQCSGRPDYLAELRTRASRLIARIQYDGPVPGWLRADDNQRPFFHAAEAGLPALCLLRAGEIDSKNELTYRRAAETLLRFELAVTKEVENPFGYGRQYTQDVHGTRKTAFFIPHENETGYWWQGENARLSSLAAAAGLLSHRTTDDTLRADLRAYAFSQLDWICGKNPFDACMLHGFGRGNGNYMDKWPNVGGGICNGITSSLEDEADVDFGRTDVEGDHGWRWYEQWLPHATWYLIALAQLHPDK